MNDVKYYGETGRFAWPIPFDAASSGVAVSLIDEAGRERRLTETRDYIVSGGNVLAACASGQLIHIWAIPKNVAGPVMVAETGPAYDPPAQAIPQASQRTVQTVQTAQAIPQTVQTRADETETAARSLQTLSEAASEYGAALEDTAARTLAETRASADEARAELESLLADARRLLETTFANCQAEANRVEQWAFAITQYNERPGVAAVRREEEIPGSARGLLIVNPHITHSPTPFMGVWPIRDLCEAQWEGLFFFGHPYEGSIRLPPRWRPLKPWHNPPGEGDGDDWIPCDHPHAPRPHCPPPHGRGPYPYPPYPYPPCDCEREQESSLSADETLSDESAPRFEPEQEINSGE